MLLAKATVIGLISIGSHIGASSMIQKVLNIDGIAQVQQAK